ncbi:MAG TPA: transposase, partial [Magnetococcales bacterium]|nr:transposase [Magnetococcales bacterium]
MNLGRHFGIGQDQWPMLCVCIENILSPQGELFPIECSASVEREAQRIANQILVRQKEQPTDKKTTDDAPPDVQEIQVDSLEMVRPRTVGVEHVGLWAMGQVQFIEMLEEIGLT